MKKSNVKTASSPNENQARLDELAKYIDPSTGNKVLLLISFSFLILSNIILCVISFVM